MTFEHLGLSQPLLRTVAAAGYTTPTPIQTKAIPHVLRGSDLLGCAQTGTGKTAAFALPLLQRLSAAPFASNGQRPRPIRILVLAPTRELAIQISDSFRTYGRNLKLASTVVFGGVNQFRQVKALKAGVDILVATPGRLLDLMNQGFIRLDAVEALVLDEADRMLDMGFLPDIRRIVKCLPTNRQTLLFSATMPDDIRRLAESILRRPEHVAVTPVASTVDSIAQSVYFVPTKEKSSLLKHLLSQGDMNRTLVFTRTKHRADKLVKDLEKSGVRAAAIHGNKSQNNRMRTLSAFKSVNPPVLVATDIAARGIDVQQITHVINFDVPEMAETYVHRIGRTARAGSKGIAISFCDREERGDLTAIERLIRRSLTVNHCPASMAAQFHDASGAREHTNTPEHRVRSHAPHGVKSNAARSSRRQFPEESHGAARHRGKGRSVHRNGRGYVKRKP